MTLAFGPARRAGAAIPWPVLAACLLIPLSSGRAAADELGDTRPVPALWLQTIAPDPALQAFLDETIETQKQGDRGLERQVLRVAVIDLPLEGPPHLAHWNGESPVYPASVPKFAYLMAAYAWRDDGRLEIDAALERQLRQMVYSSSNRATQQVFARLTETEQGPPLEDDAYVAFRDKRHAVKRWLEGLGVRDLHLVHPTYDGGRDLYGRDVQFLRDPDIPGALPGQNGQFRNRQAMTAVGTAKLLALLATDRALAPESSEEVRRHMQRHTKKQAYLKKRIAGGAERVPGNEVYAKTGTWGPIHSDAGIVRHGSGRQVVVVVFVRGTPRYRGSFIAEVTGAMVTHVLE